MKIRTGDTVIVISGKDKGKTGTVMRVMKEEHKVVVSGINMRTRHIKKTYQEAGRIIKYEASMWASKVMLLDPKTKKATRAGFKIDKDGKKTRISRSSGEAIVQVRPKKTEKKAAHSASPEASRAEGKAEMPETTVVPKPDKKPFWRRGSKTEAGAVNEPTRMQQDHTIPSQNIPKKSAGRGS